MSFIAGWNCAVAGEWLGHSGVGEMRAGGRLVLAFPSLPFPSFITTVICPNKRPTVMLGWERGVLSALSSPLWC